MPPLGPSGTALAGANLWAIAKSKSTNKNHPRDAYTKEPWTDRCPQPKCPALGGVVKAYRQKPYEDVLPTSRVEDANPLPYQRVAMARTPGAPVSKPNKPTRRPIGTGR